MNTHSPFRVGPSAGVEYPHVAAHALPLDTAARICASARTGEPVTASDAQWLHQFGQHLGVLPSTDTWTVESQCDAFDANAQGDAWASAARDWIRYFREAQTMDAAAYEGRLPPEMQRAIMEHLLRTDPRAAFALAATSQHQAAILQDLFAPLARRSLFVRKGRREPTLRDYIHASAELGILGMNERDQRAAIALCLLEAFARFLLSPRSSWYGMRDVYKPTRPPRVIPDAAPSVIEQVADWYHWLQTAFASREQKPSGTVARFLWQWLNLAGNGLWDIDSRDTLEQSLATRGVQIGTGGPQPDQVVGVAVPILAPSFIETFVPPLGGALTEEQLDTWQWNEGGPDFDTHVAHALESDTVKQSIDHFINEGVRLKMIGPCAEAAAEETLTLPTFTSIFPMHYYLVPHRVHEESADTVLMALIRSPIVEQLLSAHRPSSS